jgi:uncharacterized protein with HXXEE motif
VVSGETERHSNFVLIVIVASAAVIQLVPQVRDYLMTTWMIVGLGGAAFLSLLLLADWAEQERDRLARFHWLLLIVYLAHQFEEHGVDLFGRSYFFITYGQNLIGEIRSGSGFFQTPLAIYRTNTLLVWLPFLIAVWGGQRYIWPGLAAGGLLLTNGIFHTGVALWRAEYNPGLGSGIVLFLPAGLLYFRFVRRHCAIGWLGIASGALFGAAAHAALLLGIRFNLRAGPPAAVFWVFGLAPLIANFLYERLRQAWPISLHRQKT